jgi:general L-amino acid transport system substrate-binding protein
MPRASFRIALVAIACVITTAALAQSTLKVVQTRGMLICGTNGSLPGFGSVDAKGQWTGFDVDYCRAIAAAIFNDPNRVQFVPLKTVDRFTTLKSGQVDVLVRNSAWTSDRDTTLGITFTGVTFYDRQAFLVRKTLQIRSALDLNNLNICLQRDTTTELNLEDYFLAHKIKLKTLISDTADEAIAAYDAKRCDAYATFESAIRSEMRKLSGPDEHEILEDIIAKEPLGPAVRRGDEQWFDIVRWVHFALLNAEELSVTKANVDDQLKSAAPEIRRLLGLDSKLGSALGLGNDWAYRIIKQVGNYGEIFSRNVGQFSPLKLPRGYNALWNNGGLQFAPPIR